MKPFLRQLSELFAAHGRQLFLVGGSVRDALLNQPGQDYDLATDAPPEEVKRLALLAGPISLYTVGEKFGTVGLVFDTAKVEVTTFRAETYAPGSRKPQVAFGLSLHEDLARRDFTINALAQDLATGELIDPFGGRADLAAGIIRAVGNPEERFTEDPLRLLRAVRFAAQLGFRLEPTTKAAIARGASALAQISRERVAEEMNRILLAPQVAQGLRLLCDLGLMAHIIPEVLAMRGMEHGAWHYKDVFEHTVRVVERVPAQLDLRRAALLHDIAKPLTIRFSPDGEVHFLGHEVVGARMAREILARLRYDRATVERVGKLVLMHLRPNQYEPTWTDSAVRRLIREAGDDWEALLALSRADVTSHRWGKVRAALARVGALEQRAQELLAQEEIKALKSPLDGHELMALFGRGPGPWIRPVKEYLLNLVLDGELAPDDKAAAIEKAQAFVAAIVDAGPTNS